MKKAIAAILLAALIFLTGCRTSASVGVGYQSELQSGPAQAATVTP